MGIETTRTRQTTETDIDDDDFAISRETAEPLNQMVTRRFALKALGATAAVGAVSGALPVPLTIPEAEAAASPSTLTFEQTPHVIADGHAVAPGYDANVLIRWGDPLTGVGPAFDPANLRAQDQERQFGYNCDYVGYLPLPAGSDNSEHGLLCVNHEYTNTELMWPGLTRKDRSKTSKDQAAYEMAAHGHSVIEIKKVAGTWTVIDDSPYARRITTLGTEIKISGPAAGHRRMKTSQDPSGTVVTGTINNCAGGRTPWGTVLIAEENVHNYFHGDPAKTGEAENHKRLGIKNKPRYSWGSHFDRLNVEKEPNEPNRFGWMVEIDPYDPVSMPVKRTALGRFKHEGATVALQSDGRVVVYSGDDQRFEYLYKFVSHGRYDPNNRDANRNLLDHGTLHVAQFEETSVNWLPMLWNVGPLTPENGFQSMADIMIETRRAADLLGATPLDRPEDVEPSPVTGKVYVMLTNNTKRAADQTDAVNPRGPNPFGHIVELSPPLDANGRPDHAAKRFDWTILLKAGDPSNAEHDAQYHPQTAEIGTWLAAPDNCAFDPQGRLWISTDQGSRQKKRGIPDGMYACDLDGEGRALTRFFFACPRDAEMCGPEFTPDGKTLFVAVQHPAEGSTLDDPSTLWPDFKAGTPPRPSVVAITKKDGGDIGA